MRVRTFLIGPPRHPLLRALVAAVVLMALAVAATIGLVLGAAALVVVAATLAWRRWRRDRASAAGVIEGEFSVVPPDRDALPGPDRG